MSESGSRFSFHRDHEDAIQATVRRVAEQAARQAEDAAAEQPAPLPLHGDHSALYVERVRSRLRVFTPSGIVEGSHHHAPGVRLSDALRNQVTGEKYMLLTDVTMRAADGTDLGAAPFVLIRTEQASVVLPLDEETPAA